MLFYLVIQITLFLLFYLVIQITLFFIILFELSNNAFHYSAKTLSIGREGPGLPTNGPQFDSIDSRLLLFSFLYCNIYFYHLLIAHHHSTTHVSGAEQSVQNHSTSHWSHGEDHTTEGDNPKLFDIVEIISLVAVVQWFSLG